VYGFFKSLTLTLEIIILIFASLNGVFADATFISAGKVVEKEEERRKGKFSCGMLPGEED